MTIDFKSPCAECPWRQANHGRRDSRGFYTKANLTRLWNQIRRGGTAQSCHPTDPSHPDHRAKPESTPQECPGSVIIVLRELVRLADGKPIGPEEVDTYLACRRRGLTRTGILYWLVQRHQMGGIPLVGEPKLPLVDINDPKIGLPIYLQEP